MGDLRRAVRWAAPILTVLFLGLYLWSLVWHVYWYSGTGGWAICVEQGVLDISHHSSGDNLIHGFVVNRTHGWDPRGLLPFYQSDWWRTQVIVPLWIPVLLAGIPAYRNSRARHLELRRAIAGLCRSCGYSRSGLAKSVPCPECGVGA
jgi:hypothetical protein